MWGCTELLLINKMIQEEVAAGQRDLVCVWLDYQKAFDSVPHYWLLESLKLAKVPSKLAQAIKILSSTWATRVMLSGSESNLETRTINYSRGIMQGDSLSVLLFLLTLNPLSHLLRNCEGYRIGQPNNRRHNISHLFYVDDIKLFSSSMNKMKLLLDIVTSFSRDIGMQFGESGCAYLTVKRGRILESKEKLLCNGLTLSPLNAAESYTLD